MLVKYIFAIGIEIGAVLGTVLVTTGRWYLGSMILLLTFVVFVIVTEIDE